MLLLYYSTPIISSRKGFVKIFLEPYIIFSLPSQKKGRPPGVLYGIIYLCLF
jgi:hypothetical protein